MRNDAVIENVVITYKPKLEISGIVFKLDLDERDRETTARYRNGKMCVVLSHFQGNHDYSQPGIDLYLPYGNREVKVGLHAFDFSGVTLAQNPGKGRFQIRLDRLIAFYAHMQRFYHKFPLDADSVLFERAINLYNGEALVKTKRGRGRMYKAFAKSSHRKKLLELCEDYPAESNTLIDMLALRTSKNPELDFGERLDALVKARGLSLITQRSVEYKGKRYRTDFMVIHKKRVLVIEHDGEYHATEKQQAKDSLRDLKIKAALLFRYYRGVQIVRVSIGNAADKFLVSNIKEHLDWLTSDEDNPSFDYEYTKGYVIR